MNTATKSNEWKLYPFAKIDFSDPVWMRYNCTECEWTHQFKSKNLAWENHFDECHPELVTTMS